LGIVAVLATVVSTTDAEQFQEEPRSPYELLLARYAGGDFSGAVVEAGGQPAVSFRAPFEQAWAKAAARERLAFRIGKTSTPNAWHLAQDRMARLAIAAMLLHTEAALRTAGDQVEGQLRIAVVAANALDSLRLEHHSPDSSLLGPDDAAEVIRDWHVLAASVLLARGSGPDVQDFITKALHRYPKEAGLALELGVYYEREATDSIVDLSLIREIYVATRVETWRRTLLTAVDLYEQSLKTGADSNAEAHLRLGRVHALLGDTRKATRELSPLAASEARPAIRYLAFVFRASLAEDGGERDLARSCYREALVLYPDAQAPLLALSRLQDEAGDEAGARSWLERSFKAVSSHQADPWWDYGRGPLWSFDDKLGALRRFVHG
jgi:tetratricopeptide (TPR) repeat protein